MKFLFSYEKVIVALSLKCEVQKLKFAKYVRDLRNVKLHVTEILQKILFKTVS